MEAVRRAVLLVCLAVLTAACGTQSESIDSTTTTTQAAVSDAVFVPEGYDIIETGDGRTRSYRVVDLSGDQPAPLLFVLHGFGGTAEGMRTYAGIEAVVESSLDDGAIVVYPNGTGIEEGLPQSWNAGGCCPFSIYDMVDDVAFFDQMISSLASQYDVDERRVWIVGHSNGGMMAYRLACELSSRVTAIGVAAGALMTDSCTPNREVSAIHVHGDLDNVVPIAGGETAGIVFPSAQASYSTFASAQSCVANGPVSTCPKGGTVSLVTKSSWTHDWQREWTALIIDFLATQSRA
jgi:poly(3-hydroxybutyrate) depolymerase